MRLPYGKFYVIELFLIEFDIYDAYSYRNQANRKHRVMYYIFILDTGFCIFYNYPPRLALGEITADMPCSEDTYAASSSADCFQKVCDENIAQRRTLSPILKLLLNEDFGEEATGYLTKLTTLQYFIVLNG
jgi:hypothetical protein